VTVIRLPSELSFDLKRMYTAREMADMAETLARWEVNAENVSPLWN